MNETIETESLDVQAHEKHVKVSVELFGDTEHKRHRLQLSEDAMLLDVLDEGAQKFHEELLPDAKHPLDQLRGVYEHHHYGSRLDIGLTLKEFLHQEPVTHRFAIELVRAIRVNTRWREAPEAEMTPKAILILFGLSFEEYSLYLPGSTTPLPLDTPVKLTRGEHFEAQRDGKYGEDNRNADQEG